MSDPPLRGSRLGGRGTPIPQNPRSPILVVEDEADVRESLREILEESGYDVYCASNGKEALELLARADPRPGLILLDMVMPVMNGQEMLAALKQVHALAAIPVTIVSGSLEKPPASSFLNKPVDFNALLALVEKTCGHP